MKPHFDKVIDDFAKRLSEFVSNAGNTLYKGISEILDRTMSERKERAGEIDDLRVSTTAQIEPDQGREGRARGSSAKASGRPKKSRSATRVAAIGCGHVESAALGVRSASRVVPHELALAERLLMGLGHEDAPRRLPARRCVWNLRLGGGGVDGSGLGTPGEPGAAGRRPGAVSGDDEGRPDRRGGAAAAGRAGRPDAARLLAESGAHADRSRRVRKACPRSRRSTTRCRASSPTSSRAGSTPRSRRSRSTACRSRRGPATSPASPTPRSRSSMSTARSRSIRSSRHRRDARRTR